MIDRNHELPITRQAELLEISRASVYYLPRPVTRVLSTFVDVFRVAFLGYAAWLTYQLIQRIGGQRMAVVDLPIGLMYSVVLVGFVLMTWRALGIARTNWRRGASVLERPELAFDSAAGDPGEHGT